MRSSLGGAGGPDRAITDRLAEPDVIRGVAIIGVVVIHASAVAQSQMSAGSPLYPL
ncbi:MAG: hypothetical protein ACYC6V_07025 [Bacillota bacterium]